MSYIIQRKLTEPLPNENQLNQVFELPREIVLLTSLYDQVTKDAFFSLDLLPTVGLDNLRQYLYYSV